ncbi:MAG: helix-turn-helix domain-containing protein [bacterium]
MRILYEENPEEEDSRLRKNMSVVVREELEKYLLPKSNDELITVNEVKKLFGPKGISRQTVQVWMKTGKIPYYRISGRLFFKKSEVLESVKRVQIRSGRSYE